MFRFAPLIKAWLRLVCLVTGSALLVAGRAAAAETLLLDDTQAIAVWPAVTLLADPGGALGVEQALAQATRFTTPTGTPGNLGRQAHPVWLRLALQVPQAAASAGLVHRVLEIDYPSLNRVDLYLTQQGRVLQHQRMGNELAMAQRPVQSRTHAANLLLAPGSYELLLRVQTQSSMVLPITLRTPENFMAQESRAQMLQGVLAGLALCMLMYSLSHWVSLRDRLFLEYALMLAGNIVFTLTYFGVGAQYLWPDAPGLSMQLSPLAVLVAVAAGSSFVRATLAVREISRATDIVMQGTGAVALLGLFAGALGLLDYRVLQSAATVLGLLITLAVLPVACVRARRGERVAAYMLFGWAFYVCGAVTTAALLRGFIEPGFLSQHLYPFATTVEMAAWMAVLGVRVKTIHRNADRARIESDALRTLAHTDALTGLPNRRGLQQRLDAALRQATPQRLLAVYLLDLDGFKPINDRFGHDVGDALLVAVGQRLQTQLRGLDVVARLGGDEFVVLAAGLSDESVARSVGQKMLDAFNQPFDAAGQQCKVGLTIGYALAPLDASQADELLKRADAAMYAGKQGGRSRVERGGRVSTATA